MIRCFDGENLEDKWTSQPSVLLKDDHLGSDQIMVEFAQMTNAYTAAQGILKSRPDLLAVFPEEVSETGFNPELLVLITISSDVRTLRVVAMPRRSTVGTIQQSVDLLLSIEYLHNQ